MWNSLHGQVIIRPLCPAVHIGFQCRWVYSVTVGDNSTRPCLMRIGCSKIRGACLRLLNDMFSFDCGIVVTGGKYAMLFGVEA